MTEQEILEKCIWDGYDVATLSVFSEMFEKEVKVTLFTIAGRNLSEKVVSTLNDFLRLAKNNLPTIKDLLWQDCKECFKSISYGVELKEGETETEANHRDFKIFDQESAYQQSYIGSVFIQEEDEFRFRYATIDFQPVWEQEHGCSIIMQNGNLIAKYGSDPYFGWYEEEEEEEEEA